MSALSPNGTNASFPSTDPNVSSAMIISFEVVFSVSIFGIIIACYFVGIRRRNRLREARSREYETMVERALTRQQQEYQQYPPHFSHHQAAADSTSTLESLFSHRPPPYSPSASDPSCQRLSERDVSRLSQAMLTNHIIQQSRQFPPSSHLPGYTDLNSSENNNGEHQQLHEHASSLSSTPIQTPPMAITRSTRTESDLMPPKLPEE